MNSPESIPVLLIRANVPGARAAGLLGYNLGSVIQRTIDVEEFLVVDVLKRPTVAGVLDPPLRTERSESTPRTRRGKNKPSGCRFPAW